ncbi:hypothetical protein A9Q87_12660 [Flavobacteriales bacterium 34_180_T64]|nr:hypothetical protein A9Q87_12660 [Flavobacteriales bacterium 34_180_T64]
MKVLITTFLFLYSVSIFGQRDSISTIHNFRITPEILLGATGESNSNFPDRDLQKQFIINLSWDHSKSDDEWSQRLKSMTTGISIGYTDFGNTKHLGQAISVLPFIEFNAFRTKNLRVQIGTGMSYFNKKYDSIHNPNNKAVSTDLSWSFKLQMHYNILETKTINYHVGAGYFHHSNGHSRLPNQGYNSLLFGVSAEIMRPTKSIKAPPKQAKPDLQKSKYNYFAIRTGYGSNTLSRAFNDKKSIYSFSGEYGWVLNNTYKIGLGFYYRFYQHYYDYIVDNESLVQDGREFEQFKTNPGWNATNLGLTLSGELLLNHFGLDLQLGFNIHKPGYKIDWRINQGWEYVPQVIPEESNIVLGEFNTYYKIKHLISTRFCLKYYLISTKKRPKSNFYLGASINANLGQADFTELNIGYVHNLFSIKEPN